MAADLKLACICADIATSCNTRGKEADEIRTHIPGTDPEADACISGGPSDWPRVPSGTRTARPEPAPPGSHIFQALIKFKI